MYALSHAARADAPTLLEERGDLAAFITAHKATLPGEDSNGYVDPSPDEAATMELAVTLAQAGQLDEAAVALDALDYDLVVFTDTATAGAHLMLRERQPQRTGWGLYLLRLAAGGADLAVEVPHPIWDTYTPELGIETYLQLAARRFLMAGAHRYANGRGSMVSDMTRNPRSIFQRLHQALPAPSTQVLQLHGFKRDNHPGYPDAILSNGSAQPHGELTRLAAALEDYGIVVGVFDGQRWSRLAATLNPQGAHTRAIGGRFCHLELRHRLRSVPTHRAQIIAAIGASLLG
jgi:hypothetical protein